MSDEIKPLNLDSDTSVKPDMKMGNKKSISKSSSKKKMIGVMLGVVLLGGVTGFGLSKLEGGSVEVKKYKASAEEGIEVGDTFGVQDEKAFRDSAEGTLASGGIEGEGSHHLVREGGESQNVYLTSSVVDLDQFIDRKVKVWGETFEAQQAGWLMDAGRLEILE